MKYRLIIDKNAEEEIIAIVHAPSSLTRQIEDLVCSHSGADLFLSLKTVYVPAFKNSVCIVERGLVDLIYRDLIRDLDDLDAEAHCLCPGFDELLLFCSQSTGHIHTEERTDLHLKLVLLLRLAKMLLESFLIGDTVIVK